MSDEFGLKKIGLNSRCVSLRAMLLQQFQTTNISESKTVAYVIKGKNLNNKGSREPNVSHITYFVVSEMVILLENSSSMIIDFFRLDIKYFDLFITGLS